MLYVVIKLQPTFVGVSSTGGNAMIKEDVVKECFSDMRSAQDAAVAQASKYPGVPFAVMSISKVFETGQPIILEKTVNERGELIPVNREQ